jgi:WD40 repeat protein
VTFDEARQAVLALLQSQGRATTTQMLRVLGGDAGLLAEVREALVLDDLARDKDGVGLVSLAPPAPTAQLAPAATPAPAGLVFLSYGRADALDFVRRLAVDLQQRGYRVWLDMEDIDKGGLFEVRIEQGIRSAAVVAAVMTPSSVREQSVCRDEVVFALNENRVVVPLRAHPEVRPTLLLARRNWIDFAASYEQGLADLLRFLTGDTTALRPPRLPTVTGVAPLDLGPEVARHSAGFMGRQWLAAELNDWLASSSQRVLVLVGEPGAGKSAVAAWLCLSRAEVVGIHFCTQRNTRTLDPQEFVASLVGQLHARLPGFAEVVEARRPEVRRERAADAFRELVVEPAQLLAAQSQPCLIVVDSLDEAALRDGETIVDVLAEQAPDLPRWLRVLTTTRPEARVLDRIRTLRVLELIADHADNRGDVLAYIDARLRTPALKQQPGTDTAAERLGELAAGNFLYARLALDALEEGALAVADLRHLTPGLAGFYGRAFRQRFPDVEAYSLSHAPLLRALAVARGPLSFALLREVMDSEPEVVHRRLRELRAYLRVSGAGEELSYALFHKSLPDWLTDREMAGEHWCPAEKGHARLAEVLLPRWRSDDHALRHLVAHLLAAGKRDEAARLLLEPGYLEAKTEAGLVFDLAGDFSAVGARLPTGDERQRLLALLEEALRADIHFIARHPGCLFQCLWNRGWWYDCDAAAGHCDPPEEGWQEAPPWQRPGSRLCSWLEAWRNAREGRRPWLRSLRPPEEPLGSAQQAVLSGHGNVVFSVAVSPSGQRIASGSWDETVRIWDAVSGREAGCLRGHQGAAECVAFSPDGRRLVSGGSDDTVRIWDVAGGTELRCLRGHQGWVMGVAFAPDGRHVASASWDRTVRLWDTEGGQQVACLVDPEQLLYCVVFTPDGREVIAGGKNGTIRIWDRATGRETACLAGHEADVRGLAVSPDGRRLFTASRDRTVRVWDLSTRRQVLCLRGHTGTVYSVALSPDGGRVVSASWDRTVRVWDATSGAALAILRGHVEDVSSVAVSADGRIVSGSWDWTVRLWNTARPGGVARPRNHADVVSSLAWSADGGLLASGSFDRSIILWAVPDGVSRRVLRGHSGMVSSLAFFGDGARLASGSFDRTIRVWDVASGQELRTLAGHERAVLCVAVSADGKRISSGSLDRTVRVWDLEAGSDPVRCEGHQDRVLAVAFSPDGSRVVSGSKDRTVRLWDARTGTELVCLGPVERSVVRVGFLPGDERVYSMSVDGTVRLWDVSRREYTALGRGQEAGQAVPLGTEVAFLAGGSDQPDAWLPVAPHLLAGHPDGRTWAVAVRSHLHLVTLTDR